MGLKDQEVGRFIEDPYRCADLFNGTIFQGEQIIDGSYLKSAPRKKSIFLTQDDKVLLEEETSGKKGIRYMERERDILRLHSHPERKCYVACEGQSRADYVMPLRGFMYDGVEYSEQLRRTENERKKRKGPARPLIPVFHLVLYTGEKRWRKKHTLQEMMDIPEEMKRFRGLLPDYRTYVVDIHEQDPELFQTEWKEVFRLMRHSRKKEELREYMKVHIDEIRKLSMDTRMFMAVLLDQYEIINDKVVEVKEMCKAWDGAVRLEAEEVAKGLAVKMAEDMAKDMAEDMAKDMAEDMAKGMAKDMAKGMVEKKTSDLKKKVTEQVTEEVTEKTEGRFGQLISRLMSEKKYRDVERVSKDREYRYRLFAAYQL